MYTADVARTERLGPSFVRVTFTGHDLAEFGVGGDDQRIKLMLPQPGRTVADVLGGAGWYDAWRAMPAAIRPTMRTYPVRAFRPTAIAGEAGVIKRLRQLIVNDYGVHRSSVAFMGYWRQGRSELP
jgi:NADPH-dependent ferric siderophore reductase